MKENEFKKRFPIISALKESNELFEKNKYDDAIKVLETALKNDPSNDFTTTIRRDVWYNLSVLYILNGQIDKAFKSLKEFLKFGNILTFYNKQISSKELTSSQAKILKENYQFENYTYFLNSSKYKKQFKKFIEMIEAILSRIDILFKKDKIYEGFDLLFFIKKIIISTNFTPKEEIFSRKLVFKNKNLYNIIIQTEKLIKKYASKLFNLCEKLALQELKLYEKLIDQGQFSEVKERLTKIINGTFNLEEDRFISEHPRIENFFMNEVINKSEKIDSRAKELLEICITKEKNIKEKTINKRLVEIKKLVEQGETSNLLKELDDLNKNAIELNLKDLIKKIKDMKKIVKESLETSKKFEEFKKDLGTIEETIDNYNNVLINYSSRSFNPIELKNFFNKRDVIRNKIFSGFHQFQNDKVIREKLIKLIKRYYSPYFKINPYELNKQLFIYFLGEEKTDIGYLHNLISNQNQNNLELKEIYDSLMNKLDALRSQYIKKESEEFKEFIFKTSNEILYNFLLDFSEVLPMGIGVNSKTQDSTKMNYTLTTYFGPLNFKIIEKKVNEKIIYEYDFLDSMIKEKGILYLEFINLEGGNVKLKVKNEIHKSLEETGSYINWIGSYIQQWIESNMGKLVANQIQTLINEKSFDDLTLANYRILQEKINALGKNIENLKKRYFEVKAPPTLKSFNCPECGAKLNITSNEEKFIICEYCSTPFLIEWQL